MNPLFLPSRLVLLSQIAVLALSGCSSDRSTSATDKAVVPESVLAEHRPAEVLADGYASSSDCRDCHERNYRTWHASYHRTMTQVASPAAIQADFSHVSHTFDGRQYSLERRGDQYWAVMNDPDQPLVPGDSAATMIERPIALVTGSHHMQLYWYVTGHSRVLGLLPIHYFMEERKWLPTSATLLRPGGHFSPDTGRWNQRCIQCHATHGRTRPATDGGMDSQVVEFGISCEACHGPAKEHAREKRSKAGAPGVAGPPSSQEVGKVVSPAGLPAKTASQICGLCHSYTVPKSDASELKELQDGFFYRPGDQLADSLIVVRRDEPTAKHVARFRLNLDEYLAQRFWPDGMSRVAGREYNGLIESACYLRGEMSCLSCHAMHKSDDDPRSLEQWADKQLKPAMDSDHACLQCHEAPRYASNAHTHHGESSAGSRCYNCHLPYTTYGLLRALRSHQIERPSVATSKQTGRPNGCNLCHLDKSLDWTATYLESWYGIQKPALDDDERTLAAGALWTLSGDAGQRAIVGWNMGWAPALEASQHDWLPPLLTELMHDDYEVVRMIGYRSLRSLQGYQDVAFDFVGPAAERASAIRAIRDRWDAQHAERAPSRPDVLIDDQGKLDRATYERLFNRRNRRPVVLLE